MHITGIKLSKIAHNPGMTLKEINSMKLPHKPGKKFNST